MLSVDPTTDTALLLMAAPGPAAEQGAHDFAKARFATPRIPGGQQRVVETGIAPVDVDLGGNVLKKGSWFGRVAARDRPQWQRLKERIVKAERLNAEPSLAEQQRQLEAAHELGMLEREHPALYAELQASLPTSKASVVAIGRDDALRQMEARVQAFINSHRPTPPRARPGQHPVPVAPVPTKAQAWDWLMHNDAAFQRLYGIYSQAVSTAIEVRPRPRPYIGRHACERGCRESSHLGTCATASRWRWPHGRSRPSSRRARRSTRTW